MVNNIYVKLLFERKLHLLLSYDIIKHLITTIYG